MKNMLLIAILCVGCSGDPGDSPDPDAAAADASRVPDAGSATCPTSGEACSKRDGLIAYWRLDELSDGSSSVTRSDSTPCGNDLPDPNMVASTGIAHSGQASRHLYRDGVPNDFVRPDDPAMSVFHRGHSYTIGFWFQMLQGAPASGKIFIKGIGGSGSDPTREFGLEYQHCPLPTGCPGHAVTTNHLHYGVFDSSPGSQSNAVLCIPTSDFDPEAHLGEWQFVMLWHDDATRTMYVQLNDGQVYSRSTADVLIRDTDAPIKVGGLVNAFDGIVDEVMIWTRVLTPEERTSVFADALECTGFH